MQQNIRIYVKLLGEIKTTEEVKELTEWTDIPLLWMGTLTC